MIFGEERSDDIPGETSSTLPPSLPPADISLIAHMSICAVFAAAVSPLSGHLQEAAVELMFAAFATTASAATSLVLQLIKHPAVVAKLREELQTRALGAGALLRDISRLRYLDNVVKEVLRVLPPVSGGYRVALHTFELAVSCQPLRIICAELHILGSFIGLMCL